MNKTILVLGIALIGSARFAVADDESANDEVIVYGVRMAQPVTEVGSSVTIITAADIEAQGFDFVLDAVATAPGVTINQNGTFGGSASVRIRGASSEQTLVIIDGVVANDPTSPGGGYDFARLDPSNIERMRSIARSAVDALGYRCHWWRHQHHYQAPCRRIPIQGIRTRRLLRHIARRYRFHGCRRSYGLPFRRYDDRQRRHLESR